MPWVRTTADYCIETRYLNHDSDIDVIILFSIDKPKWLITALTKKNFDFQAFKRELISLGFSADFVASHIMKGKGIKIELNTSSLTAIATLMKAIKSKSSGFEDIEQEISQKLGIDLTQTYPPLYWIQRVSLFSSLYYNNSADSVIKEIRLDKSTRWKDDSIYIKITTTTPIEYLRLFQALLAADIPTVVLKDSSAEENTIAFQCLHGCSSIVRFMQVIKPSVLHFDDIEADLCKELKINPPQLQPVVSTHSIFTQTNVSLNPARPAALQCGRSASGHVLPVGPPV